jgi:hypothetical protein
MMTFRELMARLPPDGRTRRALRTFNLAPKAGGKVPSVKALAEDLGFAVALVPLPPGRAGRLVADPFSDNGWRIEVNSADDRLRQRWTVLHELGHYFLHVDRNDPLAAGKQRDTGNYFYLANEQHEEREANDFAEALVFGENALLAAVTLHGRDPAVLSRYFGVPKSAVCIALKKLDARKA